MFMSDDDKRIGRFYVVEGGNTPKPYHEGPAPKPVTCYECERDTGVASVGPWYELIDDAWEMDNGRIFYDRIGLYCERCREERGKATRVAWKVNDV